MNRRASLSVLTGASAAALGLRPASADARVTLRVASAADDTITPLLYAQ
jgi:hypothetical protein